VTLRISLGLSAFAFAAIAACSSPEGEVPTVSPTQPSPAAPAEDWPGPPVHATFLADGSLRIVLTAPTGGHAFAVESVDATAERATVRCAHTPPAHDAIVTQVVTEHAVLVDAAKLTPPPREVAVVCSTPGPYGKPITREVWKQAN
jgi:hypothetical protein